MPFDDPFKNFGLSIFDRLLERERSQREMVERLSRPFGLLGKHTAFEDAVSRLADSAVSPSLLRMSENATKLYAMSEKHQSLIDRPTSWSRIAAVREASLAIAEQQAAGTSNFGKLALAVGEQLNAVSKLGYAHSDLIGRAIQSSRLTDTFTQTVTLSQFQEIANRANSISAQFERLANEQSSWRNQSTIDAMMVRHVREAHLAMEAMAIEDSAEGFVSHANGLLKALAGMFSRFKGNTSNEVRDMGLLGFLAAILSFLAIWEMLQPDGLSETEREQLTVIQTEVREIREQLLEFLEGEAAIDEAFVSDLPRGIARRKAYIRVHPKRQAELIVVLPDDTPVAIYESKARWLKVVYRDPLADQLAIGWVYRPSITMQGD
ncbi:hypothetical protein [Sphingorhabdus sp.]|uniref:hypothetical protein n=1 Tax=Sphingorhabdus sp. TaxID=1902408 RepID=UPI003593AD2C